MSEMIKMDRLGGSTIYQIFLRAFTPEGTLAAAEKRLPEVADLGVKIIYLCSIATADPDENQEFWTPRQKKSGCNNPRNPYRISDYMTVDPEYGTEDDLKSFFAAAHKLGMKVFMDMVFYHAGPTFAKEHPEFVDGIGDWSFPKLNYDLPELRAYMKEVMRHFAIDLGIDGFRCDVSDYIPFDFWQEATEPLRKLKPELIMFAEGDTRTKQDQESGIFDLNYHCSWGRLARDIALGTKSLEDLVSGWRGDAKFSRLFDNHDIANDDMDQRLESQKTPGAVETLLFLHFMMDGVPFLYNGVEYCDSARHSIYSFPGQFVIDRSKDSRNRKELIRQLTALRLNEPILYQGKMEWDSWENGLLKFNRDGKIFCTINFGSDETECVVPGNAEIIFKSKNAIAETSGIKLPRYGFIAYKTK